MWLNLIIVTKWTEIYKLILDKQEQVFICDKKSETSFFPSRVC